MILGTPHCIKVIFVIKFHFSLLHFLYSLTAESNIISPALRMACLVKNIVVVYLIYNRKDTSFGVLKCFSHELLIWEI